MVRFFGVGILVGQFLFFILIFLSFFLVWVVGFDSCILVSWEIFSVFGVSFDLNLIFDSVGMMFFFVVIFISFCVFLYSEVYMGEERFMDRFVFLVLVFVFSMGLLIMIPNLVSLLIGWDGLGLVSFLLVIYYQNFVSLSAGFLTVLINRVGDVFLLLSVGWCINQGHWMILGYWDFECSSMVCFGVLMGGITKSAQIPFSSWLPAAMAAPTPVSALVHSSTLVTAGIFLLVRFYPFFESSGGYFKLFFLFLGVGTMFMAGISANFEMDLKKVIALSTLSQLGVMMVGIGADLVFLTLFHLFTHALFKALLFLCAGNLIHLGGHSQDFRGLGQMYSVTPLTVVCLNMANLALCGFPFLAGFYSKDLMMEMYSGSDFSWLIWVLFFFSAGLTCSYSLRFSYGLIWGVWSGGVYTSLGDDSVMFTTPMILLSFGAVFGGCFFSWIYFGLMEVVVVSFLVKFFVYLLTLVGLFFGLFLSNFSYYDKGGVVNVGISSFFWGSVMMWFLVSLAVRPVVGGLLRWGGLSTDVLEYGWIEVFGGQGIFKLFNFLSLLLLKFSGSSWVSFLFSILFSLMVVLY